MTTRSVALPDGSVLRIRPYRPEDREDVLRIFSSGMLSLALGGTGYVLNNSRPLKVLSYALPAASLLVSRKRVGLLGGAVATVGAAALMPCLVFALLRQAMSKYVTQSITGVDLSDIESFYSTTGAGHGSAFWVAELIEPEPATTTPPSSAAAAPLPSRPSRTALAGGSLLQAVPDAPDAAPAPLPATAPTAGPAPSLTTAQPSREIAMGVRADRDGAVAASSRSGSAKANGSHISAVMELADGADAEERQIRALVSGLVAAAVGRIEAAASACDAAARPTSPTSSLPSAKEAISLACAGEEPQIENDAEEALEPAGPVDGASQPEATKAPSVAAAAAPAVPAPGTPAEVVKRPRIGSFVTPSGTGPALLTAKPAAAAAAATVAAAEPPPPPTAAAEPPPPPTAAAEPRAAAARRPIIIGHVALERKSWRLAELRRMSVLKRYAGRGVGGRLLEMLVAHARDVGFRELVLHTSGMQPAARRLYERGGWAVSKVTRVQCVDVFTYTLDLTKRPTS
ncbi:hypothetical protein PLESTB_000562000 [Pleodorina starrii]|uniref:N-acetyltransferase domain-containing protein n=1 Tax=Pleodorina starrii TaxID=330485 RepID=A0A9W6BGR4_9CHLO|nr:hypothetical protein PLESTM_000287100 [Pleodorina starrii]GLC51911.1 hypothetical protein PLESTB_000562000 [Pleodorina starrii]GLC74592.1 hypothetical protein PLESTF_001530800 [Pleodorina starrii]